MTLMTFILFIFFLFSLSRKDNICPTKHASDLYFLIFGILFLFPASFVMIYQLEIQSILHGVICFALMAVMIRERFIKNSHELNGLLKKKTGVMVKLPLLGGLIFLSFYQLMNFAPQKMLWTGAMLSILLNGFYKMIPFSKALISFYILLTLWVVLYYTVPNFLSYKWFSLNEIFFVASFGVLLSGVCLDAK